jgi:hypothetical protein
MFELELSRCPICQTTRRLIRQMREVQGQHFVWYECPECGSALMWLGGDRWVYQQVGRADRQYLAKRPLTTVELQALSAASAPIMTTPTWPKVEPLLPDESVDEEEEAAPTPAPALTPAAAIAPTPERRKGAPMWLVIAVVIIILLFAVAAAAIIATQV